jgi:hypothetical protein
MIGRSIGSAVPSPLRHGGAGILEFGFRETEQSLAESQPQQKPKWFELEADVTDQ